MKDQIGVAWLGLTEHNLVYSDFGKIQLIPTHDSLAYQQVFVFYHLIKLVWPNSTHPNLM